jgi:uncharacterized protein (TIGR00369 family)
VTELPTFMTLLGLSIEQRDEGEIGLRMDVPDGWMSPFGAVHGGAIAALFDTGLAMAVARRLTPADRIATHNLNVTYIAFSRERVLLCRTRILSLRRAVATVEGEVVTAAGELVAKAVGTFGIRRQEA